MKLLTILNAAPALQRLCAEPIDMRAAYAIHKRLPELDRCIDFFNAEREKILQEHKGEEAEAKLRALLDFEADYCAEPIPLRVKEGARLCVNDISLLQGFITFEED